MNINRRRGAIALAITLGVLIVGGLIAYNIAWIILYKGRIAAVILGLIGHRVFRQKLVSRRHRNHRRHPHRLHQVSSVH